MVVLVCSKFSRRKSQRCRKIYYNLSVDSVINRIKEYKIKHSQYKQYEISIIDKVPYELGYFTEIKYDGNANVITLTRTPKSTWYTCKFYIEQSDIVVSCHIKLNRFPTELMLINVTSSDGHNKTYKKIFRKKNKEMKRKFEAEILDNIFSEKWKHKRWYD